MAMESKFQRSGEVTTRLREEEVKREMVSYNVGRRILDYFQRLSKQSALRTARRANQRNSFCEVGTRMTWRSRK